MKLSIILPVYNVEKFLEKSINSLCIQENENVEFIFINDGSTDNSLNILRHWEPRDKRITVIDKKNEGSGIARNCGLNHSRGEYVYFMDPDDWVEPNFIESILNVLSKKKPQVVLFGHNVYRDFKLSKIEKPTKTFEVNEEELSTKSFDKICNSVSLFEVWNKVYKKEFLQAEKLAFNTFRSGQDAYFNIEVAKKLTHAIVLEEVFYNYYATRSGSVQNSYYSYEKFYNNILIAKNYDSLYNQFKSEDDKAHIYWLSIFYIAIRQNIKERVLPMWEKELFEERIGRLTIKDIHSNKRRFKLLLLKYGFAKYSKILTKISKWNKN